MFNSAGYAPPQNSERHSIAECLSLLRRQSDTLLRLNRIQTRLMTPKLTKVLAYSHKSTTFAARYGSKGSAAA